MLGLTVGGKNRALIANDSLAVYADAS
jgi:hypothetical protein